jgi:hypothetical protein
METKETVTQPKALHVLTGIQQVMSKFAEHGIGKNRKNEQQGFKFRGIDDVMNRMAQHLVEANLVIVPRVLNRDVQERVNSRGNPLFYVTVNVEFNIISTIDNSNVLCVVPGEAMDSGDKATNKALSIAYKYMAFQLFAIPVDEDPDATTHTLGKAPAKTITPDEQDVIRKLCEQAEFSAERICEILGVSGIELIPQAKLAEVTSNLQKKIKSTKEKEVTA